MKLLIRNCFLFLLTTIGVYLLIFTVLFVIKIGNIPLIYRASQANVWNGGGTYVKSRAFDVNDQYDIVAIGSSHAYRGYDPRIFNQYGFKMFNLGTSDQNMMCSYYIIKNYIKKENCQLLILDLYDRVFTQFNIESNSDVIQNISSDKTALELALAANDPRTINMFTLRMFNKFSAPLNKDTAGFINGFMPTKKQLKIPVQRREYNYKTNPQSLKYLDMTLNYLQKEGVKVVITEHALPSVSPAPDHNKFVSDVTPILNKYDIKWFDYTNDSSLTGLQYFADESHLNVRGVYKYNHRLIADLSKANILPVPFKSNFTTGVKK